MKLSQISIHIFRGIIDASMSFQSYALLVGANIHAVLHDDDDNKGEHQEFNQLIADSKHADFTKSVVTLPKDLESVLGVTAPGSKHRKPQHLLYCYSTDQIDELKLTDFCLKVQACFTVQGGQA